MATVKATWAEDLGEYTVEEIKHGIDACKRKEWPPTLPEFLAMCRPPINYEAAFYETVEQLRLREDGRDQWPKPAQYWASRLVGGDMMRFPYRDLQTRWRNALDASMREEQTAVPPRRGALPAPGGTTTPSVAKAAAAALRQMTSQPKDPLAWARKIMERKEAGEIMPTISIEFATKALATESPC